MSGRTGRLRADADGILAAISLGLLGTAGMFYVNLLPAIVSGLRDALGYTNAQAGYVGSANIYGAAVGALGAVWIVKRVAWKRAEAFALTAMIVLDLISITVTSLPGLVMLRALHGLAGGVSVGVGLAVMARTRVPQRAYGAQFTLQVLLGGLGLMWLPALAARAGAHVLFLSLASLSLVTLLLLPWMAEYPIVAHRSTGPQSSATLPPLAATLLALFLFQAANMALYAFIIPLGRDYGLETPFVSYTLGAADWVAALGSVAAMSLGLRFGRLRPLALAMLVTVPATAAFLRSDVGLVYIVANVATGVAWSFVVPCLFGICAAVDGSGRSAALGGFVSKMGLASGPLLATFVVGSGHYGVLICASVVALVLVSLAAAWPAAVLDRGLEKAATEARPARGAG